MKRDCPKLGNREATSQLSVGQREKTQPIAAPQPTIVRDRIGAQSQAGSSASTHRGDSPIGLELQLEFMLRPNSRPKLLSKWLQVFSPFLMQMLEF